MAKSIIAGGTSYQHQPLSELLKDLQKILEDARKIKKEVNKYLTTFKMPFQQRMPGEIDDLSFLISYARKCLLFADAILELDDVIQSLQNKRIDISQAKRIISLGNQGWALSLGIGKFWNNSVLSYGYEFSPIPSKIYEDCRNFFHSTMDLTNMAGKLQEFVLSQPADFKRKPPVEDETPIAQAEVSKSGGEEQIPRFDKESKETSQPATKNKPEEDFTITEDVSTKHENILVWKGLEFNCETGDAIYGKIKAPFTPDLGEFKLLKALMEAQGKRLSYDNIGELIWSKPGQKKRLEKPRNISFYVRNIRQKLNMGKKKGQNKDLIQGKGVNGYRLI